MVVRNLLCRLGLAPDSPQLRCIATSASLSAERGSGLPRAVLRRRPARPSTSRPGSRERFTASGLDRDACSPGAAPAAAGVDLLAAVAAACVRRRDDAASAPPRPRWSPERLFGEPDDELPGAGSRRSTALAGRRGPPARPAAGAPVRPHHARHVGMLQPAVLGRPGQRRATAAGSACSTGSRRLTLRALRLASAGAALLLRVRRRQPRRLRGGPRRSLETAAGSARIASVDVGQVAWKRPGLRARRTGLRLVLAGRPVRQTDRRGPRRTRHARRRRRFAFAPASLDPALGLVAAALGPAATTAGHDGRRPTWASGARPGAARTGARAATRAGLQPGRTSSSRARCAARSARTPPAPPSPRSCTCRSWSAAWATTPRTVANDRVHRQPRRRRPHRRGGWPEPLPRRGPAADSAGAARPTCRPCAGSSTRGVARRDA